MDILVCKCMNVKASHIKEAFDKVGDDYDKIAEITQAGLACKQCLKENCPKVDNSPRAVFEVLKFHKTKG